MVSGSVWVMSSSVCMVSGGDACCRVVMHGVG